jgi:hypothetical protein
MWRWLILALAAACVTASPGAEPQAKPLHHYVYVGADRERLTDPAILGTPAFEGVQVRYSWKQLEPAKDGYDFSAVEHDLAFLQSKGKRLWVQVQDVSFDAAVVPVPKYLLTDPAYHGGADRQFDIPGDDESKATPAGWVARRWDPAVRERFAKLLTALGEKFDGRIEGINLAETALDFGESGKLYPKGFTPQGYRDATIETMRALRRAFPKSAAIVYANFMVGGPQRFEKGSYLRDLYAEAARHKLGMGGPDVKPWREWQMKNSYPLIRDLSAAGVPTGIAVQDGNYSLKNPRTGKPVTLNELVDFAQNYLGVTYVFWCTEEPYFSRDVVPRMRAGSAK